MHAGDPAGNNKEKASEHPGTVTTGKEAAAIQKIASVHNTIFMDKCNENGLKKFAKTAQSMQVKLTAEGAAPANLWSKPEFKQLIEEVINYCRGCIRTDVNSVRPITRRVISTDHQPRDIAGVPPWDMIGLPRCHIIET